MKRILFCAAVAALATACTNEDDLVLNQDNSRTQGLTFDVALAEGSTTRGELTEDNGTYPFFWYAETDRINVYAYNAEAGADNSTPVGLIDAFADATGLWTLGSVAPAEYKATKSEGTGLFTSIDDANLLTLKDADPKDANKSDATIVATYGNVKVSKIISATKGESGSKVIVAGDVKELELTTTAASATQEVAKANVVEAPMYSISKAGKEAGYQSFGESAQLRLVRPFPVIKFTTKNTADYIKEFGKLKSVTLTALGTKKADGTTEDVAASKISFDTGKAYVVKGEKVGAVADDFFVGPTTTVTLATATNEDWTDNDAVYMTVAPVDRKAFKDKGQKEPLEVEYTFENITFTLNAAAKDAKDFEKALQTDSNWTSTVIANGKPNAITALPALDINNYDFLVTENTVTNTKTLFVLRGNFKDVFKEDNINWGAGIDPKEITKIVSNVVLTDEDMAMIATKFDDSLVDITLKENTSIAAKTFSAAQAAAITHLNLPKVTKIDDKFILGSVNQFAALVEYSLPSYEFGSVDVAKAFFANAGLKTSLVKADISGTKTMGTTFGVERTLAFTGFTALEEVTVMDGVVASPNAFKGCTSLEKINGTLDITNVPDVFAMTSSAANDALESVEITGTEIPVNAFTYCTKLNKVLHNGSAIVPTAIGDNAFEGTEDLEYLDLSKAATIGKAAFKKAGIIANKKVTVGKDVLTVGVKVLNANVFEDCMKVKFIKFTEATEIVGNEIFKVSSGDPALIQVKFQKVFDLKDVKNGSAYNSLFSKATAIEFWTNPEQEGVSSNKLTLSYMNDETPVDVDITFQSIRKELD